MALRLAIEPLRLTPLGVLSQGQRAVRGGSAPCARCPTPVRPPASRALRPTSRLSPYRTRALHSHTHLAAAAASRSAPGSCVSACHMLASLIASSSARAVGGPAVVGQYVTSRNVPHVKHAAKLRDAVSPNLRVCLLCSPISSPRALCYLLTCGAQLRGGSVAAEE